MPKQPTIETDHIFQLRPGVDPFGAAGWSGVNTEDDPGSIAPNELQRGDNIRLRGRRIHNRAGLTDIDTGAGKAIRSIHGILPNTTKIWGSSLGCFGYTIGTGALVFSIDRSQPSPHNIQNYAAMFKDADQFNPMASYSTRLFMGNGQEIRELIQIPIQRGVDISSVLFSVPSRIIVKFADRFQINCMIEYAGELYVGLYDTTTPAASQIWAYDGLTWRLDISGIRPPQCFGVWRDKLVAGLDATAAAILVRDDTGATHPSTWTSVGLAGFQCAFHQNAMCQEREKLYIASGSTGLYSFDGTTLALAHNIAAADNTGYGITSVTMHQNLLHFGWNAAVTFNARLGRHDPDSTATEWVDTHKDLTAAQANFKRVCSILSYAGQLYYGGQKVWVAASADNDVQGALESVKDNGATASGFEVRQLILYP